MTGPSPRLLLVRVTPRTADILRACYRGEPPADVIERALRLLATADGHLDTGGRIKNQTPRRQP